MVMAPSAPFPYFSSGSGFNGYIYQIPSSMLQNTVAIGDCKDTVNALQWLKSNMTGDGVLLTHRTFYGWAMLESFNSHQLLLYEYDNPANAATNATHDGYNQIYLIWWINGQGWSGQPSVSSLFHEIYRSGNIAIYHYNPN